jgi:hypothetical protein
MTMIIDGTNGLTFNNSTVQASAGSVLQVVNATVGYVTTTSSSYVDTGLTATITPKFSTSKILVIVNLNMITTTNVSQTILFRLTNGSATPIQVLIDYGYSVATGGLINSNISLLHSPATTSAYTYKIQFASSGSNTLRLNDYSTAPAVSTITLMEIAQ